MQNFYDPSFNAELFRQIMTVYLGVMLTLVLCSLVQYILRSLSLFTIAKRRGIANYGLAWVPVAYLWTLGAVADGHDASHGMRRKWRTVLLTLCLIQIGCLILFYIGYFVVFFSAIMQAATTEQFAPEAIFQVVGGLWLALLPLCLVAGALQICGMICYFKLFESCKPQKAVKYLLLSLLVPFGFEIALLCSRKWDGGVRVAQEPQQEPQQPAMPAAGYAPQAPADENAPQDENGSENEA